MPFERVTYIGSSFDDAELFAMLPPDLSALLLEENGVVAYGGGFHVRGACREPAWHSLRRAWLGSECVATRYSSVHRSDIPFAEDALGDQFLLRDGIVHRLRSESGVVESLAVDLADFITNVQQAPIEYLSLEPLLAFEETGCRLEPGQLLNVYPPYCAVHQGRRSMRAISAAEQLAFLASFARQMREVPDGGQVRIRVSDTADD